MNTYGTIITADELDRAASIMSQQTKYGFDNFTKVNGEWKLESRSYLMQSKRRTMTVYTDKRPATFHNWTN